MSFGKKTPPGTCVVCGSSERLDYRVETRIGKKHNLQFLLNLYFDLDINTKGVLCRSCFASMKNVHRAVEKLRSKKQDDSFLQSPARPMQLKLLNQGSKRPGESLQTGLDPKKIKVAPGSVVIDVVPPQGAVTPSGTPCVTQRLIVAPAAGNVASTQQVKQPLMTASLNPIAATKQHIRPILLKKLGSDGTNQQVHTPLVTASSVNSVSGTPHRVPPVVVTHSGSDCTRNQQVSPVTTVSSNTGTCIPPVVQPMHPPTSISGIIVSHQTNPITIGLAKHAASALNTSNIKKLQTQVKQIPSMGKGNSPPSAVTNAASSAVTSASTKKPDSETGVINVDHRSSKNERRATKQILSQVTSQPDKPVTPTYVLQNVNAGKCNTQIPIIWTPSSCVSTIPITSKVAFSTGERNTPTTTVTASKAKEKKKNASSVTMNPPIPQGMPHFILVNPVQNTRPITNVQKSSTKKTKPTLKRIAPSKKIAPKPNAASSTKQPDSERVNVDHGYAFSLSSKNGSRIIKETPAKLKSEPDKPAVTPAYVKIQQLHALMSKKASPYSDISERDFKNLQDALSSRSSELISKAVMDIPQIAERVTVQMTKKINKKRDSFNAGQVREANACMFDKNKDEKLDTIDWDPFVEDMAETFPELTMLMLGLMLPEYLCPTHDLTKLMPRLGLMYGILMQSCHSQLAKVQRLLGRKIWNLTNITKELEENQQNVSRHKLILNYFNSLGVCIYNKAVLQDLHRDRMRKGTAVPKKENPKAKASPSKQRPQGKANHNKLGMLAKRRANRKQAASKKTKVHTSQISAGISKDSPELDVSPTRLGRRSNLSSSDEEDTVGHLRKEEEEGEEMASLKEDEAFDSVGDIANLFEAIKQEKTQTLLNKDSDVETIGAEDTTRPKRERATSCSVIMDDFIAEAVLEDNIMDSLKHHSSELVKIDSEETEAVKMECDDRGHSQNATTLCGKRKSSDEESGGRHDCATCEGCVNVFDTDEHRSIKLELRSIAIKQEQKGDHR